MVYHPDHGGDYTEVTLTEWECRQAKAVGKWRTEESRKRNFSETAGAGGASQPAAVMARFDLIGAGAEMAFAKWANVYWSFHVNSFAPDTADVGRIEIRSSDKHHHNLIIRPWDAQDEAKISRPYVFVTGDYPTFRIHGWAIGREVMLEKYWRDLGNGREPCWIMPRRDLTPLFLLPIGRL